MQYGYKHLVLELLPGARAVKMDHPVAGQWGRVWWIAGPDGKRVGEGVWTRATPMGAWKRAYGLLIQQGA
jgi:hypothetical protein